MPPYHVLSHEPTTERSTTDSLAGVVLCSSVDELLEGPESSQIAGQDAIRFWRQVAGVSLVNAERRTTRQCSTESVWYAGQRPDVDATYEAEAS